MRSSRYGRSPTSSRNSTWPGGGSNAKGVPSDEISCVSVPPKSGPLVLPGRSVSSVGAVQQRQKLNAAVTAADADDRGDRRIPPCCPNGGRASLRRSGHKGLPRKHRLVIDGFESEATNFLHAPIEFVAIKGTRGC